VILSGLIVEGNYVDVYGVEVTESVSHGILVKSKHVLIENSTVHNSVTENGINGICATQDTNFGSAFKAQIGAEDVTFRGNSSYNNCGEGFGITRAVGAVLEDNTVGSNYSVGIYVDNSYNVIVRNNTVICDDTYLRDGHRMTGLVFAAEFYDGWGMQLHDNSFLNNTVSGCYDNIASWLSKVDGINTNLTIDGNISRDSTRRSIAIYSLNQNVVVSNNILDRPVHVLNSDGLIMSNNQVNPNP
jgi:parallel beta-helix repeat protein